MSFLKLFIFALLTIQFLSCNNVKNIEVNSLETPCEHADAFLLIIDEIYFLSEENGTEDEIIDLNKKLSELYVRIKGGGITRVGSIVFDRSKQPLEKNEFIKEFKSCESWLKVEKKYGSNSFKF